jgi:hypothetical protein
LLPPAFLLSRKRRDPDTLFLASWILIFFLGALAIFFAGSARYLLPIAAPIALLVSRLSPGWLAAGFTAQMLLSVSLAIVNYQHWDGYRSFVAALKPQLEGKRVWINSQWGLRHYLEADQGQPVVGMVCAPWLVIRSTISRLLRIATASALTLVMTPAGTPAGATSPNQEIAS